ncbi:class E sortase [Microbacterium sp. KSW-18]|uniref:Class E sortase n=1 Tax=Microbacterium aquilitoris TaxID=3067307 RepID=A0ABU3GHS3_9MICO|nr:class E sortase [Microbacterium sp. KSW-18]MDT3329431.1 class E sortase [Microbacterium sp. KSW-18]
MTASSPTEHQTRRTRRNRPRPRATVLSFVGEILLTLGVVTLLYVTWHTWIGDAIVQGEQHAAAQALADQWAAEGDPTPDASAPSTPAPDDPAAIPTLGDQKHAEVFGIMKVPRFGKDWQFKIASGISRPDILDRGEIGHYPDTAMPGAEGNTVYAAHRWTSGAPFDPIDRLVIGDALVIQTKAGWYTYRFRSLEYVQDTQIQVLLPVPNKEGVAANGRYLTLTSCAPKLNSLERIIAYAVFDEFTPAAAGPPAALTAGVGA